MKNNVIAALTAGFILLVTAPAHAVEGITVIDSDLRQVLQAASKITGQKIKISPALKGVVKSQELPADLPQLLTSLQDESQIEWYQDGDTFFISSKSESITRVIDLNLIKFGTLEATLAEAGIDINKHELRLMTDANSVYFSGPPSLAIRLQALLRNLNVTKKREKPKTITFIRGGAVSYLKQEESETE